MTHSCVSIQRYIFVRSKGSDDAIVRLHSDPLVAQLRRHDDVVVDLRHPADGEYITDTACYLIYHYDDKAAVEVVSAAKARRPDHCVICLGADIYTLDEYVALADFTDLFLTPTPAHTKLLSSQLYKPVFTLGESLDTNALDQDGAEWKPAEGAPGAPRLLWFGYPESMMKSMASLLPVIDHAQTQGAIGGMTIITDPSRFSASGNWDLLPYHPATFRSDARHCQYAVLSHFSLDAHLNTYIKSPNKAVAALAAGLIPLATDTLNYGELFKSIGLERFLFSSPLELQELLGSLDVERDRDTVRRAGALDVLMDMYSPKRMLDNFQHAIAACGSDRYASLAQLDARRRVQAERTDSKPQFNRPPLLSRLARRIGMTWA